MNPTTFIIHGTGGHPQENWFPWLARELTAKGFDVFVPQFPTPEGQSYTAWREVFAPYKNRIDSRTVMIGHSLGGLFLVRFLEELETQINAAFFVATPIGVRPVKFYDADNAFSGGFDFNWPEIKQKSKYFAVFHTDNDPYVSLGNGESLAAHLGVPLTLIKNGGHLNAAAGYTTLPELLNDALFAPNLHNQ